MDANYGNIRDDFDPSYVRCGRTMSMLDGRIGEVVRLSTHVHWSDHPSHIWRRVDARCDLGGLKMSALGRPKEPAWTAGAYAPLRHHPLGRTTSTGQRLPLLPYRV